MVLTIVSLLISITTLAIVLKERTRRPFEADLSEFRAETERLIAEFNRVAERNISMMEDRLEAIERQIRIARKVEDDLALLQEEHKATTILPRDLEKPSRKKKVKEAIETPQLEDSSLSEETPPFQDEYLQSSEDMPLKEDTSPKQSSPKEPPTKSEPETPPLFDGFPTQRLKSYGEKRTNAARSHEQLLRYLKENKSKEELIDMGFSSNEINLAILSIALEENTLKE